MEQAILGCLRSSGLLYPRIRQSPVRRVTLEGSPHEARFQLNVPSPGPHAPAKNEARVLRRICAQTGLALQQVREHRVYRVELAEAAGRKGPKGPAERYVLRFRRRIQKLLGLPPRAPQVEQMLLAQWDKRDAFAWNRPQLTADEAFALAMQLR